MKFHVVYEKAPGGAKSPVRVVEQKTGQGVAWINRYLDREYVRRLSNKSLRLYAHNLLHFVRWWASVHHTGDVAESDLSESMLLEYIRFQSAQDPRPSGSTINTRVATADRALRNEFPDAPCQIARGFHQYFLHRRPMGLGRPRLAVSRLRVKEPKRCIVPLSVDEVARFWASFRTARDLAIVGLMLLQGLRSAEVLALNRDDILLSESQLRVRGKECHSYCISSRRRNETTIIHPYRQACDLAFSSADILQAVHTGIGLGPYTVANGAGHVGPMSEPYPA
jgi:integrase